MTADRHAAAAPHSSVARPHWKGLGADELFARLEAEPLVAEAFCALGDAVAASAGDRLLELVALRCSAVRDCLFVWRGHCQIAQHRDQPLTKEEIARTAAGAEAFRGADAVVLRAVDELLARRRFDDATRDAIGDRALTLVMALLFYDAVSTIMFDAEPEAAPIPGLETPAVAAAWVKG